MDSSTVLAKYVAAGIVKKVKLDARAESSKPIPYASANEVAQHVNSCGVAEPKSDVFPEVSDLQRSQSSDSLRAREFVFK